MKIIGKKFTLGYMLYFTRNALNSFFGGEGDEHRIGGFDADFLLSITVFQMFHSVFHSSKTPQAHGIDCPTK